MDHNHATAADDADSCCSTPYASAPSSPARAGYYYSAPSSPTHFVISAAAPPSAAAPDPSPSFEFDFPATFPPTGASADELFCNGQIRPMKLSTHLRHPQSLAPLIESDDAEEAHQTPPRGREPNLRGGSARRRTRSMSPLRAAAATSLDGGPEEEKGSDETTPSASRSSSAGRSSGRWVFLKEFLYRSKSEGRRNEGHNGKFWSSLSFSPVKDNPKKKKPQSAAGGAPANQDGKKRPMNNIGNSKRRGPLPSASAHELHYTANRAHTEEMRRKTFLPYRQGLLGCLGFSSKSYDAINGFARALSSR